MNIGRWTIRLSDSGFGVLVLSTLVACAPTNLPLGDEIGGGGGSAGNAAAQGGTAGIAGSDGISGSTSIAGQTGVAGVAGAGGASAAGSGGGGPLGASCVVDGTIYPSGSGNLPSPWDCNTCSCSNGSLSCTEIACPRRCPDGTQEGYQCLQCGPVDQCLSVEFKCLKTCLTQNDCANTEYCISGTCRQAIGVFG